MHSLARAGTILSSCSSCCAFGNVCNVFQFKSMTSLTLIAELLQEVFYFVDPEKLSELIAIGINVPFKLLDHFYFEVRLLKMGRLLRMIDPETGQHQVCCGLCHCSRFGQVFVVVVVVDVTVVVLSSLSPHIS